MATSFSLRILSSTFLLACRLNVHLTLAQSDTCNSVHPVSYSYLDGSFTSLESTAAAHCATPITRDELVYLTCTSSALTDGDPGPANFTGTDSEEYYIWDNSKVSQQMLFTFARNFSLTAIRINYYYFRNGKPKLRFYLVEDDFQVWDSTTADHTSTTFDNMRLEENSTERRIDTNTVHGIVSKILLVSVFDKRYRTVLSEVTFCTDGKHIYSSQMYTQDFPIRYTCMHRQYAYLLPSNVSTDNTLARHPDVYLLPPDVHADISKMYIHNTPAKRMLTAVPVCNPQKLYTLHDLVQTGDIITVNAKYAL